MKTSACFSAVAGLLLFAGSAFAQDVLKVSPATNRVLVENQYVRILQSTFKPGAKEPMHTHPAGWYYVTKAGTLKVTHADGKVEMWTPKAGEQAWMEGEAAHSAENVGKTTLQYVLVEVKAAPTKTPN
ncbi:MAG TPA: cupin domain-containing protein [Steroidobacteraceae bacterium]|nr:cupin domain-containing protein [Steroidobacteraceae bacterium]